jgi:hypothetical protein
VREVLSRPLSTLNWPERSSAGSWGMPASRRAWR